MFDRPGNWNINPVHLSVNSLVSSASHFPVNYYNNPSVSPKAFFSQTTLTSSASHFGRTSGFQYLNQAIYQLPRTAEETWSFADTEFVTQRVIYFDEPFTITDFTNTGRSDLPDGFSFTDSTVVNITTFIEELFNSSDAFQIAIAKEEQFAIIDEWKILLVKHIEESLPIGDLAQSAYIDQVIYSLTTSIQQSPPPYYTLTVASEVYMTSTDTIGLAVVPFQLSPVTSISAMPSASGLTPVLAITGYNISSFPSTIATVTGNPFLPTNILGGVTYSYNTQTAPSTGYAVTSNTYFIQWLNPAIGTVNSCQLVNFDLEFDRIGGSFSFVTFNDPGYVLGANIILFGFAGCVTEIGQIWSNNQVGYLVKGIFGSRNLNKQLNILAAGNSTGGGMFPLLTNSLLSTQADTILGTFSGAARAIAQIAGVNLGWSPPAGDVPLVDFSVAEGDTALSALSSIASEFGGVLLWNGGNDYQIAAPTLYRGLWEVPNQALITPTGIQYSRKLDINTGISGTGYFAVPIETFFDPRIYGLPSTIPTSAFPQVQKVATTTKVYTNKDPLWNVDLPLDTEEVWIQILVPDTASFVAAQYVTSNPEQWFSLGSPNIAGPYAKLVSKGGALGAVVPQAQVSYALFPTTNTDINNGNFVMSIGVTRNTQSQLFEAAVESRNQQIRNLLAKLLGAFKFVPIYSGSISSNFFGSIPLPGMWGKATVCGNTVEGIIESVSFTYPGILNIQVTQYAEINYIKNFYHIDLTQQDGVQ